MLDAFVPSCFDPSATTGPSAGCVSCPCSVLSCVEGLSGARRDGWLSLWHGNFLRSSQMGNCALLIFTHRYNLRCLCYLVSVTRFNLMLPHPHTMGKRTLSLHPSSPTLPRPPTVPCPHSSPPAHADAPQPTHSLLALLAFPAPHALPAPCGAESNTLAGAVPAVTWSCHVPGMPTWLSKELLELLELYWRHQHQRCRQSRGAGLRAPWRSVRLQDGLLMRIYCRYRPDRGTG